MKRLIKYRSWLLAKGHYFASAMAVRYYHKRAHMISADTTPLLKKKIDKHINRYGW